MNILNRQIQKNKQIIFVLTDIGLSVACIYFVYPSKFKPKNSHGLGIQNYEKKIQVRKVAQLLNEIVLPHGKWNFDCKDCEKSFESKIEKWGIANTIF